MQRYRCYYKDDFGYPYDALYERDESGDWYDAAEVDARIAELERDAARFKKLRRLNPREFRDLCERNIREGIPFDTLVDGLGS